MTNYERTHGGRTPAEDGERAARLEDRSEAELSKILKAGTEAELRLKLQDPAVRKAARRAARALATLLDFNLRVTDWSAEGGQAGIAVELQDTYTGERSWICRKD